MEKLGERGLRTALAAVGLAALLLGLLGLAAPGLFREIWPWGVSPALAAVYGTWYLALALAVALALRRRAGHWPLLALMSVHALAFLAALALSRGSYSLARPLGPIYLALAALEVLALTPALLTPASTADGVGSIVLPRPARAGLALAGLAALAFGLSLLLWPSTAEALVPWSLSPFAARALGAWYLGLAAAIGLFVARPSPGERATLGSLALALGLLSLLVAALHAGEFAEGSGAARVYLAAAAVAILVGGAAVLRELPRRPARSARPSRAKSKRRKARV